MQQHQMQQHILLLKKQLAELRANQVLNIDISNQTEKAKGNDESLLAIEAKTAQYETQALLEASEESVSYKILINSHFIGIFSCKFYFYLFLFLFFIPEVFLVVERHKCNIRY
jgi:hypothetical protein